MKLVCTSCYFHSLYLQILFDFGLWCVRGRKVCHFNCWSRKKSSWSGYLACSNISAKLLSIYTYVIMAWMSHVYDCLWSHQTKAKERCIAWIYPFSFCHDIWKYPRRHLDRKLHAYVVLKWLLRCLYNSSIYRFCVVSVFW